MTRRRQRLGALWQCALGLLLGGAIPAQGPLFGDDRPRLPGREGDGLASAWADLDGDGREDMMRATATGLDVLRQRPDGAFERRQGVVPLGLLPGARVVSVAAGRVRPGTTLPDIVVGVTGDDSLLFLNNGAGHFQRRATSPFPRPAGFSGATTQVLIAEIDGQLGDDVIALHDGALPQLFLAQPGGGFLARGPAYFPTGFFLQSPVGVVEDFDGDGHNDLALIKRGVPSVPVLLVNLAGTAFRPGAMAFVAATPVTAAAIAAGDLTGDGIPDLAAGTATGVQVFANNGRGVFGVSPAVSFAAGAVRDLAVADLDSDRRADLAVLEINGALGVALWRSGVFPALRRVLTPAPRHSVHVIDLEHDGDADLYSLGAQAEDSLLLGDDTGTFLPTETVTMPAGVNPSAAAIVVLDATGEGDPDLCGYGPTGMPLVYANDGAARFRPRSGLLPSLFPSIVLDLAPLSVARPGRRDLVVLGSRPGSPVVGLTVLVQVGGRLVDQTAARWPVALPNPLSAMATGDVVSGSAATTGFDDVVAIDDTGQLWLFENQGGVLSTRAAFGPTAIFGATQLLLGRVDNDARLDLVVLRSIGPPDVFLGTPGGFFARVPLSIAGSFPARRGLLAELTGDSNADLLILDRTRSSRVFVLRGLGNGTFADESAQAPSPLPTNLSAVAALSGGSSRAGALVFGSSTGPDILFGRQGTSFTVRQLLAGRGSTETTGVLVGDVDLDGDEDLVLLRGRAHPRVLFQQTAQLTSLAIAQLGHQATLRFRSARPGVALLFAGLLPSRAALPPYGILRIHPIGFQQILSLPIAAGVPFDLPLGIADTWPELELPLQAAFFDLSSGGIQLGNLEYLTLVDY